MERGMARTPGCLGDLHFGAISWRSETFGAGEQPQWGPWETSSLRYL